MSKYLKLLGVITAAFLVGFGFNNFAMSDNFNNYNIAVVDVNTVVANSQQVQALKKEQEQKLKELQAWLTKVREDVSKQPTEEDKQKLIKKYDAEFAKRQETVKKNYAARLQAIDKNISGVIEAEAKAQNFNLVLAKSTVLYGGTDITQSITKKVK